MQGYLPKLSFGRQPGRRVKHWDHVGDSPKFTQAVPFAATNMNKQLAASAIQALREPRELTPADLRDRHQPQTSSFGWH